MNYDSLREQAEQLDLLKYITGETDFEVEEEVKDPPKPSMKSAIKKKKKRIEDDIEKLKVQRYNKVREYNHFKKKKYGHNYGKREGNFSSTSVPGVDGKLAF